MEFKTYREYIEYLKANKLDLVITIVKEFMKHSGLTLDDEIPNEMPDIKDDDDDDDDTDDEFEVLFGG